MAESFHQIIKRIPIPLCGVVVSVASLGTLFESIAPWAHYLLGTIAFLLFAAIVAKIILFPGAIAEELENPLASAVVGTFPMMLFGFVPYFNHVHHYAGFALWGIALVLYFLIMLRFTLMFAIKTPIDEITPAYFIVYIPILLAANTSPLFGMQAVGRGLFWLCLALTFILLVLVSVRFVHGNALPKPQLPLLCIYAAPASMCTTAYLSCFENPSPLLVAVLYVLAIMLFIAGFMVMLSCLRLPFFPTYSAMTFPFVICATASFKIAQFLPEGMLASLVNLYAFAQLAIALAIVLYVLVRFLAFIVKPEN